MMELTLRRWYHPLGTNGIISHGSREICACIELPYRDNRRFISCIPEGRYRLIKRIHPRWGEQLAVAQVPNREGILIHPANDAATQLQGCIAPVTACTAPGLGSHSRLALDRLKEFVYPVIDAGEPVWLIIVEAAVVDGGPPSEK